jgi:TonB family protein
MKKYLLLLIIILSFNNISSQETKKIHKNLIAGLREAYYVLKSDKNIKHGPYSLILLGDTVRCGYYTNNIKSGIWKYYTYKDKKLEFIYNCDSSKIISDTIGRERTALYSEGYEYFDYLKGLNTEYPPEAILAGHFGRISISFSVKADGTVSDFNLYSGFGDLSLNNEALRVIKKVALENSWFPAINAKGEKVNSIVFIPVIFMLQ